MTMYLKIKNEVYTNPEDFLRRYRNTYLQMEDDSVAYVTGITESTVQFSEITYDRNKIRETVRRRAVFFEDFRVKNTIPRTYYYNVASHAGLTGSYLLRTHQRQNSQGLSSSRFRVGCSYGDYDLGRAYKGFFAEPAEAAQQALLTGRCAISPNVCFELGEDSDLHVMFEGCSVGKVLPSGVVISEDFQEMFEITERGLL